VYTRNLSFMEIERELDLYRVLRDAKEQGKKVAIIGTGTHARKSADIIVTTLRMSDFEIRGDTLRAQAGVPVAKIREEASSQGLLFPTLYDGTVGGLLATNEPSTISTAYGTPEKFTEWARIVTPVGIFRWKGFLGSKGLLGGFTEASMRLLSRPNSVVTYTSQVEFEEAPSVFDKLLNRSPIALLLEYDGKLRIHASFTSPTMEGMESYEGVPVVEENDRGSFMVRTTGITEFLEVVKSVNPVYAYYIHGVGWSKVYTSDEEELNRWDHYPSSEARKIVLRIKTVLDHWNVLV